MERVSPRRQSEPSEAKGLGFAQGEVRELSE